MEEEEGKSLLGCADNKAKTMSPVKNNSNNAKMQQVVNCEIYPTSDDPLSEDAY
jgi:hypothetical protein